MAGNPLEKIDLIRSYGTSDYGIRFLTKGRSKSSSYFFRKKIYYRFSSGAYEKPTFIPSEIFQ